MIVAALTLFAFPANAADKVPIILDTDIGTDVDDAFARLGPGESGDRPGRRHHRRRKRGGSSLDGSPVCSPRSALPGSRRLGQPQPASPIEGQIQAQCRQHVRGGAARAQRLEQRYRRCRGRRP